jgi:gas vesicle protein
MPATDSRSAGLPLFLAFLAGAAAGAVAVALTTPKSGPQVRSDLKDLARTAKRRAVALADQAGGVWQEAKCRTALAASDFRRGLASAASDLRGHGTLREARALIAPHHNGIAAGPGA